jgi:CubicO group peptidase (beta-lactamase class C family)
MEIATVLPVLALVAQAPTPPLLSREPLETVSTALAREVPAILRAEGVPGLSLAIVRDGRLVWSAGFGVANRLTGRRVTEATVFPAASLGKPIAAYAAMRLVQSGRLRLDAPVSGILGPDWTSDSAGSPVTILHLLTHTAGLSNFLGDRRRALRFAPGSRFSYSGVGFMVLQAVLETVGHGSLDQVTDSLVLTPLGMTSTWYGKTGRDVARAYGHLAAGRAATPFVVVFAPVFVAMLTAISIFRRIRSGTWRLSPSMLAVAAALGIGLAGGFLASRAALPQAAVPFALVGLLAIGILTLTATALARWTPLTNGAARIAVGVVGAALLAAAGAGQRIPFPDLAPSGGNAASSLRASALDLGRFLEELSRGGLLDDSISSEFGRVHIQVDDGIGWGLGIGVHTDGNGRALFHWGGNPAARSFLLSYPDQGAGIALLANGDLSRDGVVRIVQTALGGGTRWQSY